jgi:hypothetical protein
MAGSLVFAASYAFYIFVYLKSGAPVIYPLYLAPFVIIFFICVYSFMLSRLEGKSFFKVLTGLSNTAVVFALLFLTPVFTGMNLPDPHNFMQRKLEIMLGASYAFFIIILTAIFLKYAVKKINAGQLRIKDIFISIAVFFFTFYFGLSLWFNYANHPTGDEPAYMLTAHSIIFDRDLDLKNNYGNNDYKRFYEKELKPQTSDIVRGGKIFSYHPAMFSLLIAPFYFIAGRIGITILMNVLSALFVAMIFYFLYRVFEDKKTAVIIAAVTGLSMPVLAQSNAISGDIITGLFLVSEYVIVKYHRERVFVFSFLMAAAIWMHVKAIPVCACLSLLYVVYNRKEFKKIILFLSIQLANTAAFLIFNYLTYDVVISSYTGPGQTVADLLSTNILKGAAAFFFDRQLGLFAYSPVFVLIISGFYYMIKTRRVELLESTLIVMPYFGLISMINNLGGGSSSPRYLVPILFYFSMLLSAALREIRSNIPKYIYLALVFYGLVLSAVICLIPWFRWDRPTGENNMLVILSKYSHINFTGIFPSFQLPGKNTVLLAVIWGIIAVLINIMFILKNSVHRSSDMKLN